ncbi:hypothetical protein KEM60_01412 [Austwickia sp. TVS 96-490-7B]|uniref:LON peptidase substrate-binding domain-containing protein n=1 Tax=Austwickia sp. TVS 96-490-7B TaxID=2830843 RepID=UPI001C58234F|nr:LON peptidase substrate-binding domain-containing protein [Austwickia sp. TVS 96-490-7B]MBW3085215.1 hypothetical protein [Austwickia sp. TVS 96-490-7B]
MPSLPLFPLGAVLIPGQEMPLRIVEGRYLVLLRDLLRRRSAQECDEVGIIGVQAGHQRGPEGTMALHDVGCAASLVAVDEGDSGSFEVVVRGVRRFRLDGVEEHRRTPYLTGFVTWLPERIRDTESVVALSERLRTAIRGYRDELGMEESALPLDPVELSWQTMEHVLMDLPDRQRLLAAKDVDSRLRLGLTLVRQEMILQRELLAFPGAYAPIEPALN